MKGKVIEFKDLSDSRELVEQKIPPFFLYFFYFILILLISLLVWSFFAKKEITVRSSGIIQTEAVQRVVPLMNAKVKSVNFNEGESVKVGDIIVLFDGSVIQADVDAYQKVVDDYNNDITLNKKMIESINTLTNLFSSVDEREKYDEFDIFITEYNLLATFEEKETKKSEKIIELNNSIKQTEGTIGQYQTEIDKKKIELENYTVKAQYDGVVHFVSMIDIGSTIQAGQEILRVHKDSEKLTAQLIVPNIQITQIKVGQKVRIRVGALSVNKYGYASATVTKIESDSRVNQENGQSFYIVTAVLDQKELKNGDDVQEIKVGLQVEGRMITDTQRYLFWTIEKLDLWIFG